MPRKKSTSPDFEHSLNELETLVEQMEQGDISLERSLELFERGIKLTRSCQESLKKAELRVQQLVEKNGVNQLEDFADANEDAETETPQ
ncbi:MAG: exodeoxyribonuclease VII small subunit [Thiotrichales bacterium]|nr:exodeoxyribonuclease VII small subunit [Thiotrichales bacterium]